MRAHLLMYLFGAEILPASANPKWWMDKRARFRLPCSERLVRSSVLSHHVLAAAIWEAQRDGIVGLHLEERRGRFRTTRKLRVEPGRAPGDPHPWQQVIWDAAHAHRPTAAHLAGQLDAQEPGALNTRGFALGRLQAEARTLGFLREGPDRRGAVPDPDVDCAAVAAIGDEGRGFMRRWASFRDGDPVLHDRLLEEMLEGTMDQTPV